MDCTIELKLEAANEDVYVAAAPPWTVIDLRGEERIGAPYRFTVDLVTPAINPISDDVLSTGAEILFKVKGVVERTVRGVIEEFEEGLEPPGAPHHLYRLTIRPRIAELARFVSQDVYVGLSHPEVIRALLTTAHYGDGDDFAIRLDRSEAYGGTGWTDGDPDTTVSQPRLVIQYRESSLAFVSRLAEHLGIAFYFEDGDDKETLVFTDHVEGYAKREAPIRFGATGDGLFTLKRRLKAVASAFYAYDYSYRTPTLSFEKDGGVVFDVLGGESHLDVPSIGARAEYAPNTKTASEAALVARVRADAEEGTRERFVGRGPVPCLYPGVRFTLDDHPHVDPTEELLVVSATHHYVGAAPFETAGERTPGFWIELEIVRARKTGPDGRIMPYRPEVLTPRPRIHGVVTGRVMATTPGQAEWHQHIDPQGRYLVKLHFDQTDVTMPRVRMAQPHVGEGYGHHFPLRPGSEVLVAFLDGDPDRPVILSAVPHPLKRSPVVTPVGEDPIEVSRIQTRSGMRIEFSDGSKS